MTKKYLIASPGRTGSVSLSAYIKKLFEILEIDSQIYGTHDATLQMSEDTVVICSRRRDRWQHTVSSVIAQSTNQWTSYQDQNNRFKVKLEDFENKYVWNLRWFDAFEYYTRYTHKIDLFFEEWIHDMSLINQSLGLSRQVVVDCKFNVSPYKPDLIENLDHLKTFFLELENNKHLHSFPVEQRTWSYNA